MTDLLDPSPRIDRALHAYGELSETHAPQAMMAGSWRVPPRGGSNPQGSAVGTGAGVSRFRPRF